MKILLVSSYLPYPLFSGGQVRLYNLIRELSDRHEITLICEKRPYQTDDDIAEVKKICKEVITIDRKKQWSMSNMLKAGISFNSFLMTGHTQEVFKQKIQETIARDQFDLIHVETYYVMQNVESMQLPIVLVEHNIEYLVYKKFMNRAPMVVRPLLQLDIAKIRHEEERCWKRAKALVAVSFDDQHVMEKVGLSPLLVSNGVNTDQFQFKPKSLNNQKTKKILFLGDFKWIQNRDAVIFIIKEIWPKIKEELRSKNNEPVVKLWIVGRKIPDSVRNLTSDPEVLFDEESSSLQTEKIFQEAAFLLAPLRVGGGTSYKILESLSTGTPVVTMQMSADALSAQDGRDVVVGKTAEELAEKSVTLLQDNKLYEMISKNGRALVERNYTWKQIGKKLEEAYKKAVLY